MVEAVGVVKPEEDKTLDPAAAKVLIDIDFFLLDID